MSASVSPGSPGRKIKRKGPTFLRDDQVDLSTTDQRLLDSHGDSDWVHTDPWRPVMDADTRVAPAA